MKKLAALPFLFMLLAFPAFASELVDVRVIGRGADYEQALQDAFRLATREAFGTFVLSQTVSQEAKLIDDKVLASSQGFVESFKVLKQTPVDGLILLDVQVTLSKIKVKQLAISTNHLDWDTQLSSLSKITQVQEKRQIEAEILKAMFPTPEQFIQKAYRFDLAGLETTDIGYDAIRGNILVRVSINELFFQQYEQFLKTIRCKDGCDITEGLIRSQAEIEWMRSQSNPTEGRHYRSLGIINGYRIHSTLGPLLPNQVITVELSVGQHKGKIDILKNAVILEPVNKGVFDLSDYSEADRWLELHGPFESGMNVGGFQPSLKNGALYINNVSSPDFTTGYVPSNARPKVGVVTKNSFEIKIPFHARNASELLQLSALPVNFAVVGNYKVAIPKFRFNEISKTQGTLEF